jgi:hypothetical protein
VDTGGNLQFHIFLLERLILKDLQETSFILPQKFLLGRPSFSAVYGGKKGVEIGLPIWGSRTIRAIFPMEGI